MYEENIEFERQVKCTEKPNLDLDEIKFAFEI
jgi:hypothetical protein